MPSFAKLSVEYILLLWPLLAFSSSIYSNYNLAGGLTETSYGLEGSIKLSRGGSEVYGDDISVLKVEALFESSEYIRIKIFDPSNERWEVPQSIVERPQQVPKATSLDYEFTYSESPFTFKITRKSDGRTLFKSSPNLIYKDQYIELTSEVDREAKTYGLGESSRTSHALENGETYTLWALDKASMVDDEANNLYSSYPYYMQFVNSSAHGVMLYNSNGMDVLLAHDGTGITFKTIGGIIDLYIFSGPDPLSVVSQLTSVTGRPAMIPYWSLGFHNCKWGYKSIDEVAEVVANYSYAEIPLDTQWVDIDYMQDYMDFTTDAENFPEETFKLFVSALHSKGQHFVAIIDPGIKVQAGYSAYEQGLELDLFIKDLNGGNYLGSVWPGPTHFPDFLNPAAEGYWTSMLQGFYEKVPLDGVWIDMNEVSNFCNDKGDGQVCSVVEGQGCRCTLVDPTNKYDFPPYAIHNAYGPLSSKTLAMSATHYGGVPLYNVHNLYGISEQIATRSAIQSIRNKRPFVLSRSSFPGTQKYAAKWTGDNGATFADLKASIVSIMDFNLEGVPMIGADICGFNGDTTEELCARWIEVGAFYPFSRNHNSIGNTPQELYRWDTVSTAARAALSMRYRLLPYIYTLFYNAHIKGTMVLRPLWANFPADKGCASIDSQFMLGEVVLISPVLEEGAREVQAYFPGDATGAEWYGLWYDLMNETIAFDASSGGFYQTLSAPLTMINVHLHGGNIVPLQDAAMTTTASRVTPFTLLVTLCSGGNSGGELYWDDGEQVSLQNYLVGKYTSHAEGSKGSIDGTVTLIGLAESLFDDLRIDTIVVMGKSGWLTAGPSQGALLNGKLLTAPDQVVFDSTKGSLTFTNLKIKLTTNFILSWE